MTKKLLIAVIALTFPVLAHAKLSTQLRTLANSEDPSSAAGRTYEFKEPIELSQLDRKLWFDVTKGEKEDMSRNARITRGRGWCINEAKIDFDYPCVDGQAALDRISASLCAAKPMAYIINGKVYSPDDLTRLMPIRKNVMQENGKEFVFYDADCTAIMELFKNGYCQLEGLITKPPTKFHSLAISATDGWNFSSERSANKLRMEAYYPVDEKKTRVEPAKAEPLVSRPSCSYKNTGDEADFRKNASTHAMMMRHYGALLKEPAATPSDSGKINDSSIKPGVENAPADSTGKAGGSKGQKIR